MANLNTIERKARDMMTAHGVGSAGFEFDRSKRRLGATHFVTIGNTTLVKKITLSKHYVEILPEAEIHDVILHEIAHALVGPKEGHGPKWRAAAKSIGAKPQRCAIPSASPQASVTAECPVCFTPLAAQHRLPGKVYVCKRHRDHALVWKKNGKEVPIGGMPASYQNLYNAAKNAGRLK